MSIEMELNIHGAENNEMKRRIFKRKKPPLPKDNDG
jgi:hypothetical protein